MFCVCYFLEVKATDKAGLFDTFTMTVIIDNINEAPVFTPSTDTCSMNDMQVCHLYHGHFVLLSFQLRTAKI